MTAIVESNPLERLPVRAEDDASAGWAGALASCGGHGAVQSSTIVCEIEPGRRLGWRTDATEETQYILNGTGELRMESDVYPLRSGSVFVIPTDVRHDLSNTGQETLKAVAFFCRGHLPSLRKPSTTSCSRRAPISSALPTAPAKNRTAENTTAESGTGAPPYYYSAGRSRMLPSSLGGNETVTERGVRWPARSTASVSSLSPRVFSWR